MILIWLGGGGACRIGGGGGGGGLLARIGIPMIKIRRSQKSSHQLINLTCFPVHCRSEKDYHCAISLNSPHQNSEDFWSILRKRRSDLSLHCNKQGRWSLRRIQSVVWYREAYHWASNLRQWPRLALGLPRRTKSNDMEPDQMNW